ERLGEAAHHGGSTGEDVLHQPPLRAARGAAGELLGGGVPEHHVQPGVDGDDRVGKAREHRLVVHGARARSGTALRSRPARSPAARRAVPAAAIIAALSVHRRGGGMCRRRPRSAAAAPRAARSAPLAATPPVRTIRGTPSASAARTVLPTSMRTATAWNEAATSATCASESGACRFTYCDTAVLIPLKENSRAPKAMCAMGKAMAAGSPARAVRSTIGPPGKPRPRSFATLSKASPAAS